MKRGISILTALVLILITGSKVYSTMNADENGVKITLTDLFNISKSKSFEKAAKLIAYDGEDKNRLKKDSFNPANKDELTQVKRICKKINALMELSSKYEFSDFKTMNLEGKETYSMNVVFFSGNQKLVTNFTFIKNEKTFLLIGMN